jgi:hypothetical protein
MVVIAISPIAQLAADVLPKLEKGESSFAVRPLRRSAETPIGKDFPGYRVGSYFQKGDQQKPEYKPGKPVPEECGLVLNPGGSSTCSIRVFFLWLGPGLGTGFVCLNPTSRNW